MTKINWNSSMLWKDYVLVSGIMLAVYVIIIAVYCGAEKWSRIKSKVTETKDKVKEKVCETRKDYF